MKKLIYAIFAFVLLGIMAGSVNAVVECNTELPNVFNGHVYNSDGITPVPNVEVTVTCGTATPGTDMTNAQGHYAIELFPKDGCTCNSTVSVCVGDVCENDVVFNNIIRKNIVYTNLMIPEFSLIAAGIAFAGAGAGYLFLRKK